MIRRGPLIAALVGAGLIVAMIVALILPRTAAVHSRQKDVQQARIQLGSLQAQLDALVQDKKQAPKNRKKLKALEAQIPGTADLPGLIRLLNSAAQESAVSFMSLAPASPALTGPVSSIPAQITVTGGYFAIDEFLYRIETLPRTARITSLTVNQAGTGGGAELQAVISAEFYTTDPSAGPGSDPGPAPALSPSGPAPVPSPSAGG